MRDIHNHVLNGIDDGAKSLEQSKSILKELESRGVTHIVATPHYILGTNYNSNNKIKRDLIKRLQKETNIKLYIGNETFLDNNIIENLKNDEISTINDSRYLLVELPLNNYLDCASELLFKLRNNGIIPVIAHVERYHYLDITELEEYVNEGCLLQGNITSLVGRYGKSAKKNLVLLLKKNMIYVLGTDTHSEANPKLGLAFDELKKYVSESMYQDLMDNNFEKIVNNEEVIHYEIKNANRLFRKEKIR